MFRASAANADLEDAMVPRSKRRVPEESESYARKLVTVRSGGFDFVLDPVAELNPLDDLWQAVLPIEFAPFLLGRKH